MSKQQPNVAWLRDRFLNFESKLGHNKNSCIRKGEELKRLIYTLKQATLALWIFPQRCVGKQICGTSPNHPPKMLIGLAITGWCQNRWPPELPHHIKIYLLPNNLLWVIATKSRNHCTERFAGVVELDLFYIYWDFCNKFCCVTKPFGFYFDHSERQKEFLTREKIV